VILFSAIRLPRGIVRDITRVQRGVSGARWVAPEKLHITTAYFGDISEDQAEVLDMELATIKISSFELQLEGAGHFGHAEPHSIWLGVKNSESLESLHTRCKAAARRAGIVMERRNYKQHVTLAYMRAHPPIDRVIAFEKRLSRFNTKPFLIDQMELFSSWSRPDAPNIYRSEASYPFLG